MQSMSSIKSFLCAYHPSEQLVMLSQGLQGNFHFYCAECVNSGKCSLNGFKAQSFEKFINNIAQGNEAYRSFSSSPHPSIEELLQFDQYLTAGINHIKEEKKKTEKGFKKIQKKIKKRLESAKEVVFEALDDQLEVYKRFQQRVEKLVHRCHRQDLQDTLNPGKPVLVNKVNSCANISEVATLLKDITNFGLTGSDLNLKISEIKEEIAIFQEYLNNFKPLCYFQDDSKIEEAVNKITSNLDSVISQIPKVLNEFPTYPEILKLSCSLMKDQEQKTMLLNWICESHPVSTFKLLYKASRDGFDAATFHRLCDNRGPTLTLVKSKAGKVFGGYTDAKWSSAGNHLASQKSGVFSLDRKERYLIKQSNISQAIYAHPSYGPTFGGGHDLYICNNSNITAGSYSNLGYAYECGIAQNERQAALAGSYQFMTEEIEVYEMLQ